MRALMLVLVGCAGPDPACEPAEPLAVYADENCDDLWVCCTGDPGRAQCWFQDTDPVSGEDGLVWECAGSLTTCDGAQQEASSWACGGA